jgi:hypothetical protein
VHTVVWVVRAVIAFVFASVQLSAAQDTAGQTVAGHLSLLSQRACAGDADVFFWRLKLSARIINSTGGAIETRPETILRFNADVPRSGSDGSEDIVESFPMGMLVPTEESSRPPIRLEPDGSFLLETACPCWLGTRERRWRGLVQVGIGYVFLARSKRGRCQTVHSVRGRSHSGQLGLRFQRIQPLSSADPSAWPQRPR